MVRRTKQVEQMVEEVNLILRKNKVRDEFDERFWLFSHLLLTTNCYKGYNWYYDSLYTDVVGITSVVPRLCGTSDKDALEKFDAYLQFL